MSLMWRNDEEVYNVWKWKKWQWENMNTVRNSMTITNEMTEEHANDQLSI